MIEGYVHPDFASAVEVFSKQFSVSDIGGAALAVTHHGEVVVDIWTGTVDEAGTRPWQRDTIAMSFSTTKGVASLALHLLVDRGEVAYDEPIASYWPEFAQNGKGAITVRDLMTHRAGLHRVRGLADDVWGLLDHNAMTEKLANRAPDELRLETSGYHAITYGWLVGEIVRRVTGASLTDFVAAEIATPLEADGLFIGAPESERGRIAPLLPNPTEKERARTQKLFDFLDRFDRLDAFMDALLVDDFDLLYLDPDFALAGTEMAAANGFFTARSLAAMYGILANEGEYGGRRYLKKATVDDLSRIQVETRDYVLFLPMKWRTGYHRAFVSGRKQPKQGFGHFGFGGSGAWADPETRLSVALTLNKIGATTPIADVRLARIGGAAWKAAQRRG